MNEASFASLNPTLLARKGGAKPAMRPQLHSLPEKLETEKVDSSRLEDLGWNDMGAESEASSSKSAEVLHLTPAVANEDFEADDVEEQVEAHSAEVDDASLLAQPEPVPTRPKSTKKSSKPTKPAGRRAAFTLRLDSDRHLKLRLAATMQGKSAQALVTEALDQTFAQIPDLDALVERMSRT